MRLIDQLIYEGYVDSEEDVFMPECLDKGFVGIAVTDWHYGRPVYDNSKLEGIKIPECPEGSKRPIFFTPVSHDANDDLDGYIVFAPDELNGAITGITDEGQVVYPYDDLKEAMMKIDGWDEETAVEWIDFNTLRDYSHRDKGPVVYQNIDYLLDNQEYHCHAPYESTL